MNEILLKQTEEIYHRFTGLLIQKRVTVSTMESCTSGLVASLITDTEGASRIFPGAAVVYSNDEKTANGVSKEVLERYSVYSAEMAEEMALAARQKFHTDMGIGLTGCFANADPANPEGIPGIVYYAVILGSLKRCGTIRVSSELSRMEAKLTVAKTTAEEAIQLVTEAGE